MGGHLQSSLVAGRTARARRIALVSPALETVDQPPICRIDSAGGGD
jgi:hypothetical protein